MPEQLDVGTLTLGTNGWPGVLYGLEQNTGAMQLLLRGGYIQVGGQGADGSIVGLNAAGEMTINARAETGSLELGHYVDGRLRCLDTNGVATAEMSAQEGALTLGRETGGTLEPTVRLQGATGRILARTIECQDGLGEVNLGSGTCVARSATGGVYDCHNDAGIIARFSSGTILGGNGQSGSLECRTEHGNVTVRLDGELGDAVLGGNGSSGWLRCRNDANDVTISLSGNVGRGTFGSATTPGTLICHDGAGQESISLWGATGMISVSRGLVCSDADNNVGVYIDGHNAEIGIKDWKLRVPDHVFDDEHPLPSLAELDAYIAQHQHLPGVPSAQEVRDGGLQLVTFMMTLLEKVEELTLYTIEQQRMIDDLASRLEALEPRARQDG